MTINDNGTIKKNNHTKRTINSQTHGSRSFSFICRASVVRYPIRSPSARSIRIDRVTHCAVNYSIHVVRGDGDSGTPSRTCHPILSISISPSFSFPLLPHTSTNHGKYVQLQENLKEEKREKDKKKKKKKIVGQLKALKPPPFIICLNSL